MEEKKLAVIALGGNAILRGNQKGTVEERGAGKGDSAVAGDSGQGMEEGGRTETVEVRTCRARPQDTVGACAAHARSRRKRKRKGWTGSQTGCGRCTEHIATTNR